MRPRPLLRGRPDRAALAFWPEADALCLLHCGRIAGNVATMSNSILADIQVLTSARMAAGMTSRARRPKTFHPAR